MIACNITITGDDCFHICCNKLTKLISRQDLNPALQLCGNKDCHKFQLKKLYLELQFNFSNNYVHIHAVILFDLRIYYSWVN